MSDFLNYSFSEIANDFGFEKTMGITYKLLYNEEWDENLQEEAVNLLFFLKKHYASNWNIDWKNDAFLGLACKITLKHSERYAALQEAFEKASKPPPELLIELARCCYSPGSPAISYERAIDLLKQSLEIHPYKEAATLLKAIYVSKKDTCNENYWSKMMEQIKDENPPPLEPDFIKKY